MTDQLLTEQLTIEEYNRLFDKEGALEIIDGEIIIMSPKVFGHIFTIRTLFRLVDGHVVHNKLGEVFTESTFVLSDASKQWVKGSRLPDLIFIRAGRLDDYKTHTPDWREKPLMIVPDLVVEVVSPSDSYSDIDRKVDTYLADGVERIWIIDPQRRKVRVHLQEQTHPITFKDDQILDGGDTLPGFSVKVSELFE